MPPTRLERANSRRSSGSNAHAPPSRWTRGSRPSRTHRLTVFSDRGGLLEVQQSPLLARVRVREAVCEEARGDGSYDRVDEPCEIHTLRFLTHHRACIESAAGRRVDTLTVVPSKRGREGAHPLEQAIALAPALVGQYWRLLEPGPGDIGRNTPSDEGFLASPDAAGRSVLLIDDTFTSGAKLQSAASALQSGGAIVVAGLVLGRVIGVSNREQYPEREEFWRRQSRIPFSFDVCCVGRHV